MAPSKKSGKAKKVTRKGSRKPSAEKKRRKVKGKPRFPLSLTGVAFFLLALVLCAFFFLLFINRGAGDRANFLRDQLEINDRLPLLGKKLGLSLFLPGIKVEGEKGAFILVRGRFPSGKKPGELLKGLDELLSPLPVSSSYRIPPQGNGVEFDIRLPRGLSHRLVLYEARKKAGVKEITPAKGKPALGKAALIIDDVGYDIPLLNELLCAVSCPLTVAVLPHLPHSRESAELANSLGFEVMLHLPMEPLDYPKRNPGQGAVLLDMTELEVAQTIEGDLMTVPYAIGVNNHMGSKATADAELMGIVFQLLAERGFFFVDSRTTNRTVAFEEGKRFGVSVGKRAIFVDKGTNSQNDDVEGNLIRLLSLANEQGKVIGIAHLSPETVQALKKILPELNNKQAEFVFVSEAVE